MIAWYWRCVAVGVVLLEACAVASAVLCGVGVFCCVVCWVIGVRVAGLLALRMAVDAYLVGGHAAVAVFVWVVISLDVACYACVLMRYAHVVWAFRSVAVLDAVLCAINALYCWFVSYAVIYRTEFGAASWAEPVLLLQDKVLEVLVALFAVFGADGLMAVDAVGGSRILARDACFSLLCFSLERGTGGHC